MWKLNISISKAKEKLCAIIFCDIECLSDWSVIVYKICLYVLKFFWWGIISIKKKLQCADMHAPVFIFQETTLTTHSEILKFCIWKIIIYFLFYFWP